jgi:hypothetical protein
MTKKFIEDLVNLVKKHGLIVNQYDNQRDGSYLSISW